VPLARLPRLVEGADDESAHVVQRLWRELSLLRLKELLDVGRLHAIERLRRKRRRQEVDAQGPPVDAPAGYVPALDALVDPARAHLQEASGVADVPELVLGWERDHGGPLHREGTA